MQSAVILLHFFTRVMQTYKGDVNLPLGESSKELLSSTISTEASFHDGIYEKTLNVNKVLSTIIEHKRDINYIQILLAQIQQKVPRKILEKVFITKNCTQCKTSHTLKTGVFVLSDNKKIGKLFSKYKLLFLDQANSSSKSSQILMQQYPIPRVSLPRSPSLSNFTLAN